MSTQKPSLLITGAAGGLASVLVDLLIEKYHLVGVDPRPMPQDKTFPGEFYQVDYTHRKMADIFRKHHFNSLVHMGRVRTASVSSRYTQNVLGTKNLLNLGRENKVKNFIIFSTFHVYGAHQYNHVHITEDEPLRASQTFPELMDAIELDHAATTFLWRYRDVRTVVLRPANVIGPRIKNTISQLLRGTHCPKLLGFDPVLQFIHEKDIANALLLSLEKKLSGVYNIAGEGVTPFSRAIELVGAKPIPVPTFVAYPLVKALEKLDLSFPMHLIDYFRYPTILSDQAFRNDSGYQPKVKTTDAIKSVRYS